MHNTTKIWFVCIHQPVARKWTYLDLVIKVRQTLGIMDCCYQLKV